MHNIFNINKAESTITNTDTGYCTRLGQYELALLITLIKHHGVVQNTDSLLEVVWKNKVVTSNSLAKAISTLRTILHDKSPYKIIINKPQAGYYLNSSSLRFFSISPYF